MADVEGAQVVVVRRRDVGAEAVHRVESVPSTLGPDRRGHNAFGARGWSWSSPVSMAFTSSRSPDYRGGMHRHEHVEFVTDVPWSTSEQVRRRLRLYFLLMGVCIALVALAWRWRGPRPMPRIER